MRGGKTPAGYTVLEVMIVLAVSGVMFVIAANFINGKQAKTAFQTGVNELTAQVQAVIGEVNDGHYSDVAFGCNDSPPNRLNIVGAGPTDTTGNSQDCTFVGKILHFSEDGDDTRYEVLSLAGARLRSDDTAVTQLSEAKVTPIKTGTGSALSLTVHRQVPQNLQITRVVITDASGATMPTWNFGFTQGFGSVDTRAPNTYSSGAQSASLAYGPGLTSATSDEDAAISALTNNVQLATAATVCVTDGERWATVNVGTSNNAGQLSARGVMHGTTRPAVCTP